MKNFGCVIFSDKLFALINVSYTNETMKEPFLSSKISILKEIKNRKIKVKMVDYFQNDFSEALLLFNTISDIILFKLIFKEYTNPSFQDILMNLHNNSLEALENQIIKWYKDYLP